MATLHFTPHADQIRLKPGCRTTLNRIEAHDGSAVLFVSDHDLFVIEETFDLHHAELTHWDLLVLLEFARHEIVIPNPEDLSE
jgi:hypothetical protein